MKTVMDYFHGVLIFGGAFEEEWDQHRVQFERIGREYDLQDCQLLNFLWLSVSTGALSFSNNFTRDGASSYLDLAS